MILPINDQIELTPFFQSDKPLLIQYLHEEDIYKNTLRIPYPYLPEHADFWFGLLEKNLQEHGKPTHWCIRNKEGQLMGSIGRQLVNGMDSHADEIGYWLGKPFWEQGIMTEVVKHFTNSCFDYYGLTRVAATVFSFNLGSARVLEKAGFEREGYMKKAFMKNDVFIDGLLYAKIKTQDET